MVIKVGIIGASGYWGRKVLKALSSLPNYKILICAGHSKPTVLAKALQANYSNFPLPIQTTMNYKDVIQLESLDAVIICTPAETHFSITKEALYRGKHVFLEKPMCLNLNDADNLIKIAEKNNKILFIDHTYLHSKCVHYIKSKVDNNELGRKILYFHSNRTQLGIYRHHNVLWDLGPHDISLIKYLFPNEIVKDIFTLSWINYSPYYDELDDTIDTVLYKISYKSGFVASAFISWCYPKRARDIIVAGENKMLLFENNNKVLLFGHNLTTKNFHENINWNLIEEYSPNDNPLMNSLQCFYECIEKGFSNLQSYLSPYFSYDIIAYLEKINKVMIQSNENFKARIQI